MPDNKTVSLNPKSFSDSYLIKKSVEYVVPVETEKRSKFSVYGFPVKLLNAVDYVVVHRLDGKWHKSHANVERFLLSVGVPLLEKATEKCDRYGELMAEAVDNDDDTKQLYLRSIRFKYGIDDMCLTGGRELRQGGVSFQCLERDVQIIKGIMIRLGSVGISQSALVVLSVVWALSTDSDSQVISVPLQKMCHKIVVQFREKVTCWEEELRNC